MKRFHKSAWWMVETFALTALCIVVALAIVIVAFAGVPHRQPAVGTVEVKTDRYGRDWITYRQATSVHSIRLDTISATFTDDSGRTTIFFAGGKLSTDFPGDFPAFLFPEPATTVLE